MQYERRNPLKCLDNTDYCILGYFLLINNNLGKPHKSICLLYISMDALEQGSPTPGPRTGSGLWPVRNRAAQQEVSSRQASEASSVFIATPHCSHYCLSSASCQHYGESYNYFIIYYNVIIREIKCTTNVMCLNHPETIPSPSSPWKNCLPRNQSLVPKRLGTAALEICTL